MSQARSMAEATSWEDVGGRKVSRTSDSVPLVYTGFLNQVVGLLRVQSLL